IEEPEGMLDDVIPVAPRPVAARRAGHALQHRSPPFTDHRKRLIRAARLDLDPSDDYAPCPVLPAVLRARTPARRSRPAGARRLGHTARWQCGRRRSIGELTYLPLILNQRPGPRARRLRRARAGRVWTKCAPHDARPSCGTGTDAG